MHEQWSGWMKYLFSKCFVETIDKGRGKEVSGRFIIPEEFVTRWMRQMGASYDQLPEEEKESDRKEADKIIQLIKEDNNES